MPAKEKQSLKALAGGREERSWPARLKAAWRWLWSRQAGVPGLEWILVGIIGLALAPALVSLPWSVAQLPRVLGVVLLASLLLRGLHRACWRVKAKQPARRRLRDLALMAGMVILMTWMAWAVQVFAGAFTREWTGISPQALAFAAPLCAGPVLVRLLLGGQAALLLALAGSFLGSWFWPDAAGLFLYFFVTGLAAVRLVEGGRTRASLISAGLGSSLQGAAVVVGLALYRGWFWTPELPVSLLAAALGGVLGGVLAAGLAPLVEMALGYTTDHRLMELGSLDHPILRELMLQAPGTYHHSLVVGSLVEAAAREIGANHLLAKVAALYHDIGKIKKAAYFIENQMGGPNRHSKLAPSMSALILTSHIKEGVEIAKRHHLGQPIIDIMAQHHGTRLIPYFYHKAVECRKKGGQPPPDPEAFRYPGPRPQTREAGLVMLADVVEAACRALDNPTPSRVQKMVQDQINQVFAEGQLDECELTLKDLHKIAKSFITILSGIFHQRVEYPQDAAKARKNDADHDRQSPGGDSPGPGEAPAEAAGNLRRLGMSR